jgi:hypothetical protein
MQCQCLLGLSQFAQRDLPTLLQFGGDQAVVGVDAIELPLGEQRLVAQPLHLLRLGAIERIFCLLSDVLRPLQASSSSALIVAKNAPTTCASIGAVAKDAERLADRTQLQERGKDQADPLLDLAVGVLHHHPMGVTCQTCRQEHRQFAPFGFVQQASRQAAAQSVQLDFGNGSLQAQKKAAISRARVVDPIAVANQALPITA